MEEHSQAAELLDAAQTRRRLLRNTIWVSVVASLVAYVVAGPHFGLSIALGGALGVLNVSWVSTSLQAILHSGSARGEGPPRTAWKFIFRYFIIAATMFVALQTGWFRLPGMLLGLCAFVGAALMESVYCLLVGNRRASV
ncbi:MAG: ATP synthase subunit I [Acidobacteria bacterium]|nr:ATP synthase subunit I [Acidobacteriota bacterium]